jgi:hypothetical protein
MDELVECLVKRKITAKAYIGRCLIVALGSLFLCITLVLAINLPFALPFAFLFDLAVGFGVYFVFRNTNVEYEYSFFAGELTVDKIMNRAVRKRLTVFQFSQLDFMAPAESERFDNYEISTKISQYDYSTNDYSGGKYIAKFNNDQGHTTYLMFSPNEELMAAFKKMYSRKIYED